jgi:hypothetical protein
MQVLRLQNIKKMSKEDLDTAIGNCFEYAPEATPIDRLAVLQEAQFYARELERRDDTFIAKRDLWLEIIVIVLITMELLLGFYQERQQSKSAEQQQQVLVNLQASSASTANALGTLASTTEKMNQAIQTELGLNYGVTVEFAVDKQTDGFSVKNTGKTDLSFWGVEGPNHVPSILKKAKPMTPGDVVRFVIPGMYQDLIDLPVGIKTGLPIQVFLRNEFGVQYTAGAWVNAIHEKDTVTVDINGAYVSRTTWSK